MQQEMRDQVTIWLPRRSSLLALVLGLASVLLVSRSAGYTEPQPVKSSVTAVEPGEPDAAILQRMPMIDLQVLIAAETARDVPRLVQAVTPASGPVSPAYNAALDTFLSSLHLPETALLYSGDWYGERLHQAAARLDLSLSTDQLNTLEAIAIARSANTRWLLMLASSKRDMVQTLAPDDWVAWLFLETWRMHAALGPAERTQAIRFRDGTVVEPVVQTGATWALLTGLSAGATLPETEQAMATFVERYAEVFGEPSVDEAQPTATAPFLYRPYSGALTGRAYFDHTYPTVDYGGQPNIGGMLDYLGRTSTNYDSHDADDLWMPLGSPVLAPVSGSVLWVDSIGPDYGLLIRPPGTTYDIVIVHLSEVWSKVNTQIVRGQQIGRSGQASIPHIHVEVRHNGRQTDSRGWYGSGPDPCTIAGPSGRYGGCEAGVWLWADESPPGATPTPTPLPRCRQAAAVAPVIPLAQPELTARVLLPLMIYMSGCQPR